MMDHHGEPSREPGEPSRVSGRVHPAADAARLTTTDSLDLRPLHGMGLDLDQYCGSLWAIEESRGLALWERARAINLSVHVGSPQAQAQMAAAQQPQSRKSDAIEVIEIQGTLTKRGMSLSSASSMIALRRAISTAAKDPDIAGILLVIDSPGGTVAGTADLAKTVAEAAARKPTWAYIEDLAASAAYWIASQTSRIIANDRTAIVGSIGTYMGIYDLSGMAAREGIKAVVIRSGPFKGAGFPGTEITAEQKADWQRMIDDTQAEFSAGVARGRKLSPAKVAELADGRVHLAAEALHLGLIDGIESYSAALAGLQRAAASMGRPGAKPMSEETKPATIATDSPGVMTFLKVAAPAPTEPASYHDLVAACAGADDSFVCAQLKAKATVEQARAAWSAEQQARLAAKDKEIEQLKASAAKPGVAPLASQRAERLDAHASRLTETLAECDSALDRWNAGIEAKVAAGTPRASAVRAMAKQHPELQAAVVAEANAK